MYDKQYSWVPSGEPRIEPEPLIKVWERVGMKILRVLAVMLVTYMIGWLIYDAAIAEHPEQVSPPNTSASLSGCISI